MGSFDSTPTRTVTWHIVWQAVEGRDLLVSPALADRIRLRLLDAHRQPDRVLLHYLLAPTEIHLLSRLPAGQSPRDVARTIGNIVARWVRQAGGVPGIVFAGRYRAYAIESDEAAREEFRMLAWRPVALGLCRAPTHHAQSSLRATLGLKRALGFETLAPLRLFGESVPEARNALRGRIARGPSAIEQRQWELTRGMVLALGDAGSFSLTGRPVQGLAAALVAAGHRRCAEASRTMGPVETRASECAAPGGDGLAGKRQGQGAGGEPGSTAGALFRGLRGASLRARQGDAQRAHGRLPASAGRPDDSRHAAGTCRRGSHRTAGSCVAPCVRPPAHATAVRSLEKLSQGVWSRLSRLVGIPVGGSMCYVFGGIDQPSTLIINVGNA